MNRKRLLLYYYSPSLNGIQLLHAEQPCLTPARRTTLLPMHRTRPLSQLITMPPKIATRSSTTPTLRAPSQHPRPAQSYITMQPGSHLSQRPSAAMHSSCMHALVPSNQTRSFHVSARTACSILTHTPPPGSIVRITYCLYRYSSYPHFLLPAVTRLLRTCCNGKVG
jgi:hypothetical protein